MSIQNICRYTYILIFSVVLLGNASIVLAQTDTVAVAPADTAVKVTENKRDSAGHQLCIGVDIFHLILNTSFTDRYDYEGTIDYYLGKQYYAVVDAGWGGCWVNYPDLKYSTTNNFFRVGFNKSLLARNHVKDWDMLLVGIRFGRADITRSSAAFTVVDSLWGNNSGSAPDRSFNAYWAELTGGVRVELVKGLCAGWNVRGKLLMNAKSFQNLQPLYIAGYGKGDKKSIFDFNFYISYAIRWKKKGIALEKVKVSQE